jgi:ribosomal protein S18 acetylase RimI-like enzyme
MALVTSKDGFGCLHGIRKSESGRELSLPLLADNSLRVCALSNEDEPEVLSFLAARPVHTVTMASFIRDNGLVSPLHRGEFYACRGLSDELLGVALVGHTTLFEARAEGAIEAFACLARECSRLHLLMGEQEKVQRFWKYYALDEERPRLLRDVTVLEQRSPCEQFAPIEGLRPATLCDLEGVLAIQASMIEEEAGVSPLHADPAGFRRRYARRVEQGRVWVLVKDDEFIFKADIISDTPEAVYIEGVYVSPRYRNQSYGRRCLSQMSNALLQQTLAVSLFVDVDNPRALAFYLRSGYAFCSRYNILYF